MTQAIQRLSSAWCSLVVVLLLAAPLSAQVPDEFTNLKVLDKDIGKQQLINIMRGWSKGLGVRCNHCHVGKDPNSLEGYDFASDDPEPKRVAREMMKMSAFINREGLAALERKDVMRVQCVTCHRGLARPETIVLNRKIQGSGCTRRLQ